MTSGATLFGFVCVSPCAVLCYLSLHDTSPTSVYLVAADKDTKTKECSGTRALFPVASVLPVRVACTSGYQIAIDWLKYGSPKTWYRDGTVPLQLKTIWTVILYDGPAVNVIPAETIPGAGDCGF